MAKESRSTAFGSELSDAAEGYLICGICGSVDVLPLASCRSFGPERETRVESDSDDVDPNRLF